MSEETEPEPTSAPRRPRNPLRSESDAFWLLGVIGAGVAAIVLAAAIGGAWLGVPVAIGLGALAVRAFWRWIRDQLEAPSEGGPDGDGERAL